MENKKKKTLSQRLREMPFSKPDGKIRVIIKKGDPGSSQKVKNHPIKDR